MNILQKFCTFSVYNIHRNIQIEVKCDFLNYFYTKNVIHCTFSANHVFSPRFKTNFNGEKTHLSDKIKKKKLFHRLNKVT